MKVKIFKIIKIIKENYKNKSKFLYMKNKSKFLKL